MSVSFGGTPCMADMGIDPFELIGLMMCKDLSPDEWVAQIHVKQITDRLFTADILKE